MIFWVCLGQYGFINDFLGLFGSVWVMNYSFGFVWVYELFFWGLFGSVWVYKSFFGFVWVSMGL